MALWFPRLPTDRLKRHKTNISAALPLVVAEKAQNALRLSAVDQAAHRLGLHVGQPLANARAMVPELDVVPANPQADAALLLQLADWCDRFTPVVALDAPDGLFLDMAGTHHILGGEQSALIKIRDTLRAKNFTIQAAIAGTALSARALARYRDGSIVDEHSQAKAVSPLPIEALQLDPITTHAFRKAGLKTIGQAAARKRSEIVSRFGAATLNAIDEALGQSGRPISLRKPAPDYWDSQGFAEPIATVDVIRTHLQDIAINLCAVMEREGVGARRLEASFYRADGAIRHIAVETAAALRAPQVIDRLFHERLESLSDPLDPGFGFDLIRLAALRVEPIAPTVISLDAKVRAQAEIDFLADRLAARFGRERLRHFHPNDAHRPEAAWLAVPVQEAHQTQTQWHSIRQPQEAPRRPLRLLLRPEPVELTRHPLRLRWRKALRMITQWEGPERLALEWWQQAPRNARDYYRAEDEAGRRYWLYCDLSAATPQWFLHGLFA